MGIIRVRILAGFTEWPRSPDAGVTTLDLQTDDAHRAAATAGAQVKRLRVAAPRALRTPARLSALDARCPSFARPVRDQAALRGVIDAESPLSMVVLRLPKL